MKRETLLKKAGSDNDIWDIIIIGGGATGLGILHEASARGYRSILFEQHDFASATSSSSTKLIHGGIRYLKDFSIPKLLESAKEQEILKTIAPHLVDTIPFIIPCRSKFEHLYFRSGLLFFDLLTKFSSRSPSRPPSKSLPNREITSLIPNLNIENLHGGIKYYDCQFDDARYALSLAISAEQKGGVPLNYCKVISFIKTDGKISGTRILDTLSATEFEVRGKVIINACGPFVDQIRKLDAPDANNLILPMQGSHLLLPIEFLGSSTAFIIPDTSRGTVLYGIPWQAAMLIGTTETKLSEAKYPCRPSESEIDYLLEETSKYLLKKPSRSDILGTFSGIRPLIKPPENKKGVVPREHAIYTSDSGLLTITGGKWTTYRVMAEDVLKKAIHLGKLPHLKTPNTPTPLAHYSTAQAKDPFLKAYGTEAEKILQLEKENPELAKKIHPELPVRYSMIQHALTHEMALTLEDILSRRTRAVLLNRKATIEASKDVAEFLAKNLGKDNTWVNKEIERFVSTHP